MVQFRYQRGLLPLNRKIIVLDKKHIKHFEAISTGRFSGKAQKTTLTLGLLQQQAHVTSHILGKNTTC
jgi:hypothetical protein